MAYQQHGFTLVEVMITIIIIGVLALIAIPQYQDAIIQAQIARIYSETTAYARHVDLCLFDNRTTIGNSTNQCDPSYTGSTLMTGVPVFGTLPPGQGVPIMPNPLTHTSVIVTTIGNSAHRTISGQTLTLTRGSTGGWKCTTTVSIRYVPTGC